MTTFDASVTVYLDGSWWERHHAGTMPAVGTGGSQHDGFLVGVGPNLAWIDEALAPLIHSMWRLGIRTDTSCADVMGDGEQALIGFEAIEDASAFLRIVTSADDGEGGGIWDRATGSNVAPDAGGTWEWPLSPRVTGGEVAWGLSVVFPVSDVPELVRRLEERRNG